MSGVCGIGGSAQGQHVQQLRMRDVDAQDAASSDQAFSEAMVASGVDPAQVGSLRAEMQDAVRQATERAGTAGDRRAAAQQAVDSVLEDHGVDPLKFKSKLHEMMKSRKHKHGHRPAQSAPTPAAPAVTPAGLVSGADQASGPLLDMSA